ncbi:MAG: prolyl oligopeptidase family serine peptidase, partial [Chloroflexota bacterium]
MPRRTDPETVIRAQVVLEEHDLSQDGRFAVVVRRFVHRDRYRSHLWLVPLEGNGKPIALTSGAVRDSGPRISPDGGSLAFRRTLAPARLRDRKERSEGTDPDVARLRILSLLPGDKPGRTLSIRTPRDRSVGEIGWAPDGARLAITLDAGPPRFIEGPEPKAGEEPVARRITRIDWRWDEVGHVDRWQHVHVVKASAGATPSQVTEGDFGVSGIAWSPDGRSIAFAADPRPEADVTPRRSIWTVAVGPAGDGTATGAMAKREVLALGGDAHSPAWSPDGRWLVAIGYVPPNALDDVSPTIVVAPSDGSAVPWPLAPDLDRPVGNWVDTDLHGWTSSSRPGPAWLDDRTVIAIVSDRGRAAPWSFPIDPSTGRGSGSPAPLATGDVAANSLGVAARSAAAPDGRVTVLATVGIAPMELLTVAAQPSKPTAHSRFGSAWARGLEWPQMRLIEVPGPAGAIETWVASPRDAGAGPLPTIVDIHGGPLGAWAPAPSLEVVLLCARGYRVLLPNIRGSASYGADWIRPQLGDWGGVDAADVHAAIDHAIGAGLADPERLGVLGLSYGGFMVNWLVATSERFKAAVSENGVANQVSSWAAS